MTGVDLEKLKTDGPEAWAAILSDTGLLDLSIEVPGALTEWSMASTIEITRRAINHVLATDRDPLEAAHAVARLAESSLHSFYEPTTGRRYRNLAAAKRFGTFFTPPDVALQIAAEALRNRPVVRSLMEPAAGTAMLSCAVAVGAAHSGRVIRSITAVELNPYLARIARQVLESVVGRLGLSAEVHVQTGDALLSLTTGSTLHDAIVMNPPYGRIKFEKSSVTNAETKAADRRHAEESARKWLDASRDRYASLAGSLQIGGGTLDFQRLFIAASLEALTPEGRLVVISPSSWIAGRDAAPLRSRILSAGQLASLHLYREDAHLFPTVNQPTAIATFDARNDRTAVQVHEMSSLHHTVKRSYEIAYSDIDLQDGARIPLLPPALMSVYRTLSGMPRLRDVSAIRNARGELDLTLDRALIDENSGDGETRLIRGDHVERYQLRSRNTSAKAGVVSSEAADLLRARPKGIDVDKPRIVGRQVSYMGKERRLSFAVVPAGVVIANSCNYLTVQDDDLRYALLALMNSSVIEWWFRVHSSNNHVSNYEIGDIPWALEDGGIVNSLATLARQTTESYVANPTGQDAARLEETIDALVFFALGIPPAVIPKILTELNMATSERVASLVAWFNYYGVPQVLTSERGVLQHAVPTLSALDIEMLEYVPQGGNWQQIPVTVPSARLAQIRAMTAERGVVRTTYYGRLRPDQPAYTVATYYNRPGNGTNIHPYENRTLTHREAARLQSFPDSYVFMGAEGAIRNQIGNAVPTLLGYAVGDALKKAGLKEPIVDLFAGAGGLSAGLEMAGHHVAVAVDHDPSCEATYTFNRPSERIADPTSSATLFRRSDLSSQLDREATLAAIRQKLGTRPIGALVGGPPCQGFSHAGFRDEADQRNDLAVVFMDFVKELGPAYVVLENVEGLLTYKKGQVARELIATLRELGYSVGLPWVLAAEQYGVPQMRRRVFIVGSRSGQIDPPRPLLQRCLGRREREPNDIDVDGLRYPVTVADAFNGLPELSARTHPNTGARSIRGEYEEFCRGRLSASAFLESLRT